MPILVKHSGNAAPALVGAYGGGAGKRQAEDARTQAELQSRATEANKGRDFAAQQADLSRKFAAGETDAGQAFAAGEAAKNRDFSANQADLNQQRQQQNIEFGYSAQQRAEFNKMTEALAAAEASGDFTPDELSEMRRQVQAKQAGMAPLPRLKKLSGRPEGQDAGDVWSDKGALMTFDAQKGMVVRLGDDPTFVPAPTWKDKAAFRKALILENTDATTGAVNKAAVEKAFNEMFPPEGGQPAAGPDRPDLGAGSSALMLGEGPLSEVNRKPAAVVPAKDVAPGAVVERTLKDGTKVRVRKNKDGKWEAVANA